jgi:hypothetical protein
MIVEDADVALSEAKTSLIQAQAAVHTTKLTAIAGTATESTTKSESAEAIAQVRLDESLFRREAMVVVVAYRPEHGVILPTPRGRRRHRQGEWRRPAGRPGAAIWLTDAHDWTGTRILREHLESAGLPAKLRKPPRRDSRETGVCPRWSRGVAVRTGEEAALTVDGSPRAVDRTARPTAPPSRLDHPAEPPDVVLGRRRSR